jgi:Inner membrane component of T3SS, cytoplasmic domain
MGKSRRPLSAGLLVTLLALPLWAAGPTVRVGGIGFPPVGPAAVPVEITGAAGVGAMHVELVFDPSALEAVAVEKGPATPEDALFEANTSVKGRVIVGFAGISPVTRDGPLFTARLKRIGGSGSGVPLTFEKVEAWAADDQRSIPVSVQNGVFGAGGRPSFLLILAAAALGLLLIALLGFIVTLMRKQKEQAGATTGTPPPLSPPQLRPKALAPPPPAPRPPVPVVSAPASATPVAANGPAASSLEETVIRANFALRVTSGKDLGRAFPLGVRASIGRSDECEVRLEDVFVSRVHTVLEMGPSGCVLTDMGSGNGTWVNGTRVTSPVLLSLGDEIAVGDTKLSLESPSGKGPQAADGSPSCPKCGKTAASTTRFCSRCGNPMT